MKQEQVKAIFLLADIEITDLFEIKNGYWPDHSDYDEMRRKSPWWLVKTSFGLIRIGWRKRVIEIDWKDTGVSFPLGADSRYHLDVHVTSDSVTKWGTGVHAYSYGKAIDYLQMFKQCFGRDRYLKSLKEYEVHIQYKTSNPAARDPQVLFIKAETEAHAKYKALEANEGYEIIDSGRKDGTVEEKSCRNCGTTMCDRSTMYECGPQNSKWTPVSIKSA